MATDGATITRAKREADWLKTVQAVVDGMLRVGLAAQRLGLSRGVSLSGCCSATRLKALPGCCRASAAAPATTRCLRG